MGRLRQREPVNRFLAGTGRTIWLLEPTVTGACLTTTRSRSGRTSNDNRQRNLLYTAS